MNGLRETKFNFMGTDILVKFSQCPLNTNLISAEILVPTNKGIMTYTEFVKNGGAFTKDLGTEVFVTDSTITPEVISKIKSSITEEIKKRQKVVVKTY